LKNIFRREINEHANQTKSPDGQVVTFARQLALWTSAGRSEYMSLDSTQVVVAPVSSSDPKLHMRVLKIRHELHNSIGHILGFSEMLLEEAGEQGRDHLRPELERILQSAKQMIGQINEDLHTPKIEAGLSNLPALERLLCDWSEQVMLSIAGIADSSQQADNVFKGDLLRITDAARRTNELARNSLGHLTISVPGETTFLVRAVNPLLDLLPDRPGTQTFVQTRKQGAILIVDDLDENRELLFRRLARLGYSVEALGTGEEALEKVNLQAPDLILLDILMPGLDGFEVLRRLKSDPMTRHIPIIMLSSADQTETAVRCIELGADDFLPKPFNSTLLEARIESSLSKKRLRDQETTFLKHLRAERDISERLLLNILPRPIAERLKQGEKVIADSFPEVTVLFSDFVGFTNIAAEISPRELVTRLNEIFSSFDDLCDLHGLEKIKMIGDAYMAVGGLPTTNENHAGAAAELALAMQREAARLGAIHEQPLRMRIGLHTGPVVAGVIGAKKFAYDLWGDTVNLASRMESNAEPDTILVTDATYQLLGSQYAFQPGRMINVKGKGEVLSYRLISRR
jgi:class 3 adenylate cyclase